MPTFKVEFRLAGDAPKTFTINSEQPPEGGLGLRGSVLDLATGCDIDIDHACGGVSACSTCHIIVKEGLSSCSSAEEAEEDQLDKAPGLTPQSRLACQAIPDGSQDLVVEIPNWNRNLVREGR
jgi:2Fe-2S ferredoxin